MEYEIHFASEPSPASEELRSTLASMGFIDDPLHHRGVVFSEATSYLGNACPLIDIHMTWSTFDRDTYMSQLRDFDVVMSDLNGSVSGYAHAEVIRPEWDADIETAPFNSRVVFPVDHFELEPSQSRKTWDIHISANLDTLSAELAALFESANFYYIDLLKSRGLYRIFTIQGDDDIIQARELFDQMKAYLVEAGGMEGSIKFEQTTYWRILGSPQLLPPRVSRVVSSSRSAKQKSEASRV